MLQYLVGELACIKLPKLRAMMLYYGDWWWVNGYKLGTYGQVYYHSSKCIAIRGRNREMVILCDDGRQRVYVPNVGTVEYSDVSESHLYLVYPG
jgi:hypothetical protein